MTTPLHDKDHYRAIKINGYFWGGFDCETGLHIFSRHVLQSWQEVEPGVSRLFQDDNGRWHGFWENIFVTESDIEDGSAEWMMNNGYTRTADWMTA